jgi:hypothetical protein
LTKYLIDKIPIDKTIEVIVFVGFRDSSVEGSKVGRGFDGGW